MNSLSTRLKRSNIWPIVRNCTILFVVPFVVLVFLCLRESRKDYIATPFIQPWLPAIFSSYRVAMPSEKDSPFLVEFKNPCYLKMDENRVYGDVLTQSEGDRPSSLSIPSRVQVTDADGINTKDVLKCLPYYFVLGWAKCGTSDLHEKMMAHPYILRAPQKEPAWFNNHRYVLFQYILHDL